MGFAQSRQRPITRVGLVGLSETGKSHFLSVVCVDGTTNDETRHPTNGLYRETLLHNGRELRFTEFGWLAVARGLSSGQDMASDQEDAHLDVLMWFIDEHDTHDDVRIARSHVLSFCQAEPQTMALAVIFNKGRPTPNRRAIVKGQWTDHTIVPDSGRGCPVTWHSLGLLIDVPGLRALFVRGVYLTELSYRDPDAASLLLDWVCSPDALTN